VGIRGRLIALSIGVAVPLVLVGLAALVGLWRESREQLDLSVEKQAQLAAVAFERWVDGQRQPLTTLAAYAASRGERPAEVREDLARVVGTRPNWLDLRVLDAAKNTLAVHPGTAAPLAPELTEELFAELGRRQSWTAMRDWSSEAEHPVLLIGVPLGGGGAVVARVDGAALRELFKDILLPPGGVIAVFDARDRLLYRSATAAPNVGVDVSFTPLFAALNERRTAVVESVSPYDGVERVYGLAHAGAADMVVMVGTPSALLHAPARRQLTRYAALSGLALLAALAATILLARGIVRPVRRLDDAARAFGAGDLAARTPAEGGGEIGRLAETFNVMAAQSEERESRLAELDRLKSEFVSSVSHELRTPLTTIKTLTRLLLRGGLPEEERREYLETISVECDRQIDLVLNLLDLSRIEAGKAGLSLGRVDAGELLSACVLMERHAADSRGHELLAIVPPGLPPARADRTALRRVLCSLIENAIKYTPDGGSITLKAEDSDGEVLIRIADTGRGIAPEDVPHVFEKFYRGRVPEAGNGGGPPRDASADTAEEFAEAPGVGLGLYIAQTITRQMGGAITVESAPGCGSTFTVRLPVWRDGAEHEGS
jgi:signal transduction histidine kinase